jgi:Mn2+/Fe2+ NRAMP family transporter
MKRFFEKLGPGILYAGAAIGVSHLVQSTRAGANYGFYLAAIIVLANVLKFPFFEISPIYTSKKKEHLMQGYYAIHPLILVTFLLTVLATFLIVLSAITLVTSGISALLIPGKTSLYFWIVSMSSLAAIIVFFGKYELLKTITKYIVFLLSLFTLIALGIALANTHDFSIYFQNSFNWESATDIAFLLALIGWMPAPMELSSWHSSWALAGDKIPKYKNALLDFNTGYWGTMMLALAFMMLGALVMFNSGNHFPDGAISFANQLISLFTSQFGAWSFPIIAIAAFATMFTTLLTCFDGYPRVIADGIQILFPARKGLFKKRIEKSFIIISALGVMLILYFYLDNIKLLVDFATTISFIAANLIALFNFIIAYRLHKAGLYPKGWYRWVLMALGLVFLFSFTIIYLLIN